MDRDALAAQLQEGRSIEAIARASGRAASTVAYWVNKHGLTSQYAARHAARGGIEREAWFPQFFGDQMNDAVFGLQFAGDA